MTLIVTALAVLWAWEYLLVLCPLAIPAWMQPALVAGCAVGAEHVPHGLLNAAAIAGAVALLHRYLAPERNVHTLVRRRSRRLPSL